ncbi:hypothetical protein KUTeg_005192 [Tegillarca granosa]|uniref:Tyrosine-protein kinase ephrin type A/B receptor-like domain-containing protein n=1 Tax=Tegillarca granosa TaxID=220873 RepID=A0ABQ9FJ23_TEGGR|nr:hypothetical protein KUTeg_005192 [Tegillarca granosa]
MEECPVCKPGHFSNKNGSERCEECPIGHFQRESNKTLCVPCEAGNYCNTLGCHECPQCPEGCDSDEGSENCTLCEKGFYKKASGMQICEVCPDGYYTTKEGSPSCTECPVNNYCPYPYEDPKACPKSSVCPPGSLFPLSCNAPFFMPDLDSLSCQATVEFIALVSVCGFVGIIIITILGIFVRYKIQKWKKDKTVNEESQPLTQSGTQYYTGL